jgi:hypothetical protein
MERRRRITSATFWICILATTVTNLAIAPRLHGQTLNVIHNFAGGVDGEYPLAGLTIDQSGTLYGTTAGLVYSSGPSYGSVFRLKLHNGSWLFTPLYDFRGTTDGAYPLARVVIGSNGTLYGTANRGGVENCTQGCGLVFNLHPTPTIPPSPLTPWIETVLYSFEGGTDGAYPGYGDIVFDQSGAMYNTASQGGLNNCSGHVGCGVVYKITHSGGTYTESALYAFTGGADGAFPIARASFDGSGNLYTTAFNGGNGNSGTIIQLAPSGGNWNETISSTPRRTARIRIAASPSTAPETCMARRRPAVPAAEGPSTRRHCRVTSGSTAIWKTSPESVRTRDLWLT